MSGRPRTSIGTYGSVHVSRVGANRYRARTRFRDADGQLREVKATAATRNRAIAELKGRIVNRPGYGNSGTLSLRSPFGDLHAAVVDSAAFGPLGAALRRAEAYHYDLERLVPRIVGLHGLDDADDIAAVLRYRVDKLAATPPRGCKSRPRLIAGLIPEPLGEMAADDRQAIDERKELIESRARTLAADAFAVGAPWTRRLGPTPSEPGARVRWLEGAATVAAYRDRHSVTSDLPVGGGARHDAQRADRQRALAALRIASRTPDLEPALAKPPIEVRAVSLP